MEIIPKKMGGHAQTRGQVGLRIIRSRSINEQRRFSLKEVMRWAYPQRGLDKLVNEWREQNWAENVRSAAYRLKAAATLSGLIGGNIIAWGDLHLTQIKPGGGLRIEYGLASLRVITDTGVAFLVDAWQNSVELEIMKYHGIGTGTNAEAAGDTALQTELTTQYNPDSTRATGSLTEGATSNIFRTVGTNTVDATAAVTEHGILSQAATGGGTLWDRSKFTVINLASGDSLQSTYDMTASSGG